MRVKMKITLHELRRIIKEELEKLYVSSDLFERSFQAKAYQRIVGTPTKQFTLPSGTGSSKRWGYECDPYVKMLVADSDAAAAEEYMAVHEEPDQDLEYECAIEFIK